MAEKCLVHADSLETTAPRARGGKGAVAALVSAAAAVAGLVALPGVAHAQDTTFRLDRLRLGGGPNDAVGLWSPEIAENPTFYGNFALALAWNPFRIEHHIQDDDEARRMAQRSGAPVREQFTGYFTAGFEALGRIAIQASLPATFVQLGNETSASGVPSAVDAVDLAVASAGDLRFDARGRIYSTADDFFRLGANATLFAPTGNEFSFMGDKATSGALGVSGSFDWTEFELLANTGVTFRPSASVNDFDVSHEWTWGVGAFLPLRDATIRLGAEIFGSAMIAGDDAFKVETTPIEWLAEGRFALDDDKRLLLTGFGGTRIAPGYAPDFRIGASIGYSFEVSDTKPPSPPREFKAQVINDTVDTDKDGYPDSLDLCPTEPEDKVPPFDTDGCPVKDKDGDGIVDGRDKCVDVPEDKDGIDDKDGCPEDDADSDKILDAEDACPKEPGEKSAEKDKNGCPRFIRRIAGSNEIQILKKVEFEFGSAKLSPTSFPILDEVVSLLVVNPDITKLSIEGHTDDKGNDALNLKLSKERARSCLDYLVRKGIAEGRLTSDGFGETKPLEPNETPEGRAKNRRVEFKITDQLGGASPASPSSGEPSKPVEEMPNPGE
jgi:OOP family OmpA-OmpF porin